nr:Fanconi anemia core complex-associated protein 100 isoform X9 [Manis javanica]
MASLAPRVDYLARFRCPLRGLAAGKARVLCHGAEIFLSTGSELVHVYDQEARRLTTVYKFPSPVWHLELLALRRTLYILCAGRGIYCLSLDQAGRSMSQDGGDDGDGGDDEDEDSEDGEDGEPPCPVVTVDPDACALPGATLCTFTLLDGMLVTVAQGPARWKVQLFECPRPGEEPRPGCQIGEVELPTGTPLVGSPTEPAAPCFLPVLCCVSPRGCPQGPGSFMLEDALFGLLFGADASLLESPVVLCGLPDGQICCVVLKTLVTSRLAPGDPKALAKILHHLEEPVVFIGALRTESLAEDVEDVHDVRADCLVVLGHQGRILAVRASWDEAGSLVPQLREYRLPGPVLCAACGGPSRMYHGTPSDLCMVDLARGGTPWDPTQPGGGPGRLPAMLCPTSLNICSIITLCVSSRATEGGTKLLALSAKGRLMTCGLDLNSEVPCPTLANAGQKIKDLLSGIGTVSERVSSLKRAVDQRNKALTCLNEAMNVSCALLSGQEGARPISCTTTTTWSRLQLRDVLMATCQLDNHSGYSLGHGWALCIQVLTSSCAMDLDSAGSAVTYTVPVGQLGPGGQQEVTLPLGPGEDGTLHLPVTVSCALYYSLREVVGRALALSPSSKDPSWDECPCDILPEQEGMCLPLSEHTVDMLQCLRFPSLAMPCTQAPSLLGPASDPVDTFLGACCLGPGTEPAGPSSQQAKYLPPSVAAIKVSAELLRAALGRDRSGSSLSLCCATLQWLLAKNAAADAVRARALSSVQGVAPDGTAVHLTVRQCRVWAPDPAQFGTCSHPAPAWRCLVTVMVTSLCPEGPVQAVEIQVESPSLANMCQAHHAIIERMQRMVVEQAARSHSPPDLRLQYLHQIQANHEKLLREVRTLRDQLCAEDEARSSAAATRLLQVQSHCTSFLWTFSCLDVRPGTAAALL